MRYPVLLAEITYIFCFQSITALPDLVARQACDSITCPDWTETWEGLTGAADGSAAWWLNLVQPTSPSITIPEDPSANPVAGPPVPDRKSQIELFVNGEPSKPNVCEGFDPSGLKASGPEGNQVSNSPKPISIQLKVCLSFE